VKKKLKFIIPVPILLIGLYMAYSMFLAPKPAAVKPPKVNGTLVPLTGDFVINLAGGHFGKLTMAVLLSTAPVAAAAGDPVTMPEDAAVRSVITDQLTGLEPAQLTGRQSRHAILAELLKTLKASTDEPITQVLITDMAVQ
jgi:flagellar basal body-associated protein FliL